MSYSQGAQTVYKKINIFHAGSDDATDSTINVSGGSTRTSYVIAADGALCLQKNVEGKVG